MMQDLHKLLTTDTTRNLSNSQQANKPTTRDTYHISTNKAILSACCLDNIHSCYSYNMLLTTWPNCTIAIHWIFC